MAQIDSEKFVCIDCETTGLGLEKDRIIEVGIAVFTLDEVLEQFETLVDPEREISEESIRIHHITQSMCEGKPKIGDVLPQILTLIGKYPIMGHGVGFDVDMLHNAAKRCGMASSIKENIVLDTLRMARLYGDSKTNSLEALRVHFNIADEGAHRAMSDVLVNVAVFRQLAKDYKSLKELLEILKKPIAMKTMPLGKHKGRPLSEIPLDYLRWAAGANFDRDLLFSIRSEINNRSRGNNFSQSSNPFQNFGL